MALQFPANPIVGDASGTYEYTDPQGTKIIYTWDGEKWITTGAGVGVIPDIDDDSQQPGTLDGRYVNIPGDHMTGNLKIGPNANTDNIELLTTGYGIFDKGISFKSAGSVANVPSGVYYNTNNGFIALTAKNYNGDVAQDDGSTVLVLSKNGNYDNNKIQTEGDLSVESKSGDVTVTANDVTVKSIVSDTKVTSDAGNVVLNAHTGSVNANTSSIVFSTGGSNFASKQFTLFRPQYDSNADQVSVNFFYPRVQNSAGFNENQSDTYVADFGVIRIGLDKTVAGSDNPQIKEKAGLIIGTSLGSDTWDGTQGDAKSYGIKSDLNSAAGEEIYNFYASGSAPNFIKGSTYIGGTTSRSTYELWKSTLTEEQLEQLETGTLVAPANVATPGDGTFARQWYYDQQDAETQALLDSGEIEYPTHLAATTFTDTFALGDTTNIDLRSNGLIEACGIGFKKNWTSNNVKSRGIVYSSSKKALLSINKPNNANESVDVFLARTDNTSYDSSGNRTPVDIDTATCFKAESPLGNAAGQYGSYKSYIGFYATDPGNTDNDAEWTGDKNSYGFFSGVSSRTQGTGQTYNFYAAGTAPNFFAGPVLSDATFQAGGDPGSGLNVGVKIFPAGGITCARGGAANILQGWNSQNNAAPTVEIRGNGSADFTGALTAATVNGALANVSVQMEADDPNAFTSTFQVEEDEEGNEVQVETSTYTGTTENLLNIIRDLRARVAALEAAA